MNFQIQSPPLASPKLDDSSFVDWKDRVDLEIGFIPKIESYMKEQDLRLKENTNVMNFLDLKIREI